jgi:glucosamine--fructose-6-phosphate aminotransferase (isomerizing)
MAEVAFAAKSIGRRVVAVVPEGEQAISQQTQAVLPVKGNPREAFAPLVYSIPGELLAAERAAAIGADYFRSFGDGRTVEGMDGASRIRDSHMLKNVRR